MEEVHGVWHSQRGLPEEVYVEGVFSPADMMKLFEKLLIVSEVNAGEYYKQSLRELQPRAGDPVSPSHGPAIPRWCGKIWSVL